MKKNFKFHAIAIVSICLIVTLLSILMAPQKAGAPSAAQSDRQIQVYSATWGENCNSSIDEALLDRQSKPLAKDDKGVVIEPPKLEHVATNNVLKSVAQSCNGQLTCDVVPNSEVLGVEPIASCNKHLVISYRCFNFDRLWTVTADQGITTKIDCTNETAAPAPK